MAKRTTAILLFVLFLAAGASGLWAFGESSIKGGFMLGKGSAPGASWLLIQESNYFYKNLISFGYEIQFSYYKSAGAVPADDYSAYPLNVFFNTKVKLVRKGFVRPFLGAGIGLLTSVQTRADGYTWEKISAAQGIAGLAFGVGDKASFQVEARVLTANQDGYGTRFMVAAGLNY